MSREPTGQEVFEALAALRADPGAKRPGERVYEKLLWMWRRKRGFLGSIEEEAVLEAWLKVQSSHFDGQSAGEAIGWLNRVAWSTSMDRKRREKRARVAMLRLAEDRRGFSEPTSHEPISLVADDEAVSFVEELRDLRLPAFLRERFPTREYRDRCELAFLAAMDREAYQRELDDADDSKERQRLQKLMGRGRDELWVPFLEELLAGSYEDWQSAIIGGLRDALLATRRADHGRTRGPNRSAS